MILSKLKHKFISVQNTHNALRSLLDSADIAHMTLDDSFRVVHWNNAARLLFSPSFPRAQGVLLKHLMNVDSNNSTALDFLNCLELSKDSKPLSCSTPAPDNSLCSRQWHAAKLLDSDGNFSGFSIIALDSVNGKQTPDTDSPDLPEKDQITDQGLFTTVPIGIYRADSEGRLLSVNPELAWMLGYESPEQLTRLITDAPSQLFKHPGEAEEFYFNLFESDEVQGMRLQLCRRNHSALWCSAFAKTDRNTAGRISGHTGIFINITDTVQAEAKLNEAKKELRKLSLVDGLTQIANRRAFDIKLDREWKRLSREQGELSLILCDIDFFKRFNDTYGHVAGDECLRRVAQAIKAQIKRPADMVARYGGEEFAVILPNTHSRGAVFLAEGIRNAVRALNIPHQQSDVDTCLTLSLGTATLTPGAAFSLETLTRLADDALYGAKNQGRNRTINAA